MADPEKFLERWSRRKREATPSEAPEAPRSTDDAESKPVAETDASLPAASPATSKPAFDLSKLPSLDSITAATDVRPFLARGVPSELTRAALRRAWETDPAIRNFVGLQENDWDFNKPNAIAGFGELPAGADVKKMVARLFGETEGAAESDPQPLTAANPPSEIPQGVQPSGAALAPTSSTRLSTQAADKDAPPAATVEPSQLEQTEFVHDSKNIAPQNKASVRRKHGSALPES